MPDTIDTLKQLVCAIDDFKVTRDAIPVSARLSSNELVRRGKLVDELAAQAGIAPELRERASWTDLVLHNAKSRAEEMLKRLAAAAKINTTGWLTVSEAANKADALAADISRACTAGDIECVGKYRARRINPASLNAWIQQREKDAKLKAYEAEDNGRRNYKPKLRN